MELKTKNGSEYYTFEVDTGQAVITVIRNGKELQYGGKMYFLKGLTEWERNSIQANKDRDLRWAEYASYKAPPGWEYEDD